MAYRILELRMTKTPSSDMNRHDIVAAIRKRGMTLSKLSQINGYRSDALRNALNRPWPKAEAIIAACLDIPPQTIWPTRYRPDGIPKSGRGERKIGRNRTNTEST